MRLKTNQLESAPEKAGKLLNGFKRITEQKFKSKMCHAETMRRYAEPERAEYWAGYIRGLRRAYHGENFGTEVEHKRWLSCINDRDEQRGQGYRDGLVFEEDIKNKEKK